MDDRPDVEEALALLERKRVLVLATVDGARPAMRPMTILRHEGSFYTLTSSGSPKISQIRLDPRCQLFTILSEGGNSGFIRMDVHALEIQDPVMKRVLYGLAPYAPQYWSGPDDPGFCLLRLDPSGMDVMMPGDECCRRVDLGGQGVEGGNPNPV
jgi:general stress protein 26